MTRIPVVLQTAETDCGPAALAALLRHRGHSVSLARVRTMMDPGRDGASGLVIRRTAAAWGLQLRGRLLDAQQPAMQLGNVPTPFLIHLSRQHYLVVERVRSEHAIVMDPAVGRRKLSLKSLAAESSGLVMVPGPDAPGRRPAPDGPGESGQGGPWPALLKGALREVHGELWRAGDSRACLPSRGSPCR